MQSPTRPLNHNVRIVTAASLFDGHDAAINIMRRVLQSSGAEVIHLGHNRSALDLALTAVEEDAQAIAITSYQGGHVEYFKYVVELLASMGSRAKVFGGGGGTILPSEIAELHAAGVARLYSPDDGRAMGLQGMIDDLLRQADFPASTPDDLEPALATLAKGATGPERALAVARLITLAETHPALGISARLLPTAKRVPVLGVTGTGGAGKSSLVDELVRRFLNAGPVDGALPTIAVLSVDPTRRRSGGALLGDRIRMNAVGPSAQHRAFMRSMATRGGVVSQALGDAVHLCQAAGFDLVIVETPGIGQSDSTITGYVDLSLYVMTHEYGAASQLEKIDMLDFADIVAINKFDKAGSLDALRDVRKQVQRNRQAFTQRPDEMPVYGTVASEFGDPGVDRLFHALMAGLHQRTGAALPGTSAGVAAPERPRQPIVPGDRVRYLAEIADECDRQDRYAEQQAGLARKRQHLRTALSEVGLPEARDAIATRLSEVESELDGPSRALVDGWPATAARYREATYRYEVRGRTIEQPNFRKTLSGLDIPRVALPRSEDHGELLRWRLRENLPGEFPFTAGVFPLKREGEDPARMFAGEGGPERTNRRFHYLASGMTANRLSTAFDSVTLYGEDPDERPDIYGKVGNSGVSIATLDDAKKLYSGFDLSDAKTSVSMTINGPAPMLLAFYMNAAIDQQCERVLRATGRADEARAAIERRYRDHGATLPAYQGALPEGNDGLGLLLLGASGAEVLPADEYARIAAETVSAVRGTVQADILKEDQAQNTCIFSTEFALRMQGDIQVWFAQHAVKNFYSISISGYHIAEAGANPISQLAFTLSNGFTFVEYFLARGLHIDAFAPNLSFFFSNGMDPEYSVMGRVARRIWARAIRYRYGGNARSQQLKYHIQTSGRSLHAQEIAFNDIRTTLQALLAIQDNCNSLHTNAYDEAITTPTEESVRRALAIQHVINREYGMSKNENNLQGSFIAEELTDLVEQAVLAEFRRISDRGGVLGAMERMYQRTKIQEESLFYESKKHSGELPIIGVNTFLDPKGSATVLPPEVIRATTSEKDYAIASLRAFHARNAGQSEAALAALRDAARSGENTFDQLMKAARVCSLGQISASLYDVGGQYRRNM
ncbi:MAG: cobalamin-dependent protein [Myxococcales bacterium]|nr:cobalamin-dependent protein [Myxococcales bacterium]